MSTIYTTILFSFISFVLFSQNYYRISFDGSGENEPPVGIDGTGEWNNNFPHANYSIFIDTIQNSANIWQIGQPQKIVFSSAQTLPNAIITDTLNSYPINDTSSFIIKHIASGDFPGIEDMLISFDFYVNSDTLTDYGKIEVSLNNGTTWIDINDDPNYFNYLNYFSSIHSVFSGNSTNWNQFGVDLTDLCSLFNVQNKDTIQFKFTFISDGIQTNKDGLMIDNIHISNTPPIGLNEQKMSPMNLNSYPNPTQNNITITFDKVVKKDTKLIIYSNFGAIVYETTCAKDFKSVEIDTKNFNQGMYTFKLINEAENISQIGKFMKE
jgi:hypothetical protein